MVCICKGHMVLSMMFKITIYHIHTLNLKSFNHCSILISEHILNWFVLRDLFYFIHLSDLKLVQFWSILVEITSNNNKLSPSLKPNFKQCSFDKLFQLFDLLVPCYVCFDIELEWLVQIAWLEMRLKDMQHLLLST